MYQFDPATFETIKEGHDHRPSSISTATLLDHHRNQKLISGHPQRTIKEAENDAAYEAVHLLKSFYGVGVKDVNYEELKSVKEELSFLKQKYSKTNEELKNVLKSFYSVKDVNYKELKSVKEELSLLKQNIFKTDEELKNVKEQLKRETDGHSKIIQELEDAYTQKLI